MEIKRVVRGPRRFSLNADSKPSRKGWVRNEYEDQMDGCTDESHTDFRRLEDCTPHPHNIMQLLDPDLDLFLL